jgi:hypothetical protein
MKAAGIDYGDRRVPQEVSNTMASRWYMFRKPYFYPKVASVGFTPGYHEKSPSPDRGSISHRCQHLDINPSLNPSRILYQDINFIFSL